FSGGSVADRGANPESEAVWTVDELQILLDLWVLTTWQTKPQSGLRLPDIPRRTLSPNQMYQALSVAAPQVPVGLSEADYIALMPMEWRTIQPYGINLHSLTYDSEMLHPFRGRTSGLSGAARGRWEVRYDPYNLRQIWVRDHHADRWITANWTLSTMTDQPLSREVLHAARANLASDDVRAASSIDLLKEEAKRAREENSPGTRASSCGRPGRVGFHLICGATHGRALNAGDVATVRRPLPYPTGHVDGSADVAAVGRGSRRVRRCASAVDGR
ncbi:hypothetical protein FF38_07072, partial [Lucilia cuprina]